MFNALNSFISRLDADPSPKPSSSNPDSTSYGFQVLRNTNSSLPIEPWFDFIIGINGHYIVSPRFPLLFLLLFDSPTDLATLQDNPDPTLFSTEISNCATNFTPLTLDLWSAKGQRPHTLSLPPPTLPLNLTLQLAPLSSTSHIWHVLTIPSPLSPAHLSGLLPHSDYILGSPAGTLRGESALGELVEDHLNRTLVLWVWNSEFDVVREVELTPRRGWGGEGALGAVLGYGALHRLPTGLGEEVQGPGEQLFEFDTAGRKSTEEMTGPGPGFMVPAETAGQAEPPPLLSPNVPPPPLLSPSAQPPKGSSARKARKGALSPNQGFDDMFNEFAEKSKEVDYVPSRKGTPLKPPPKLGKSEEKGEVEVESVGEPGEAEES